jgi:hypothetical protein
VTVIALTGPRRVAPRTPGVRVDAHESIDGSRAARKLLCPLPGMIGNAQGLRLVAQLALTSFIVACTPHDAPPPGGGSSGGPNADWTDAGSDASRTFPARADGDATASDALEAGTETGVASDSSPPKTGPFQGFDVTEVPPYPDDAAYRPIPPDSAMRGGGDSTVCYQQLAWLMNDVALDTSSVPSSAASQLNPLFSTQHPLTLADFVDASGHYWLQISGTETNGVRQQYFPYQYATAPASLAIAPSEYPVLTATPPSGGWIRLVDSSQAEVWIEITQISANATAGDPLCQSLTNGRLTAIVPATSGNTPLVLGGTTTTVAGVFGATTATAPLGWTIGMTFTATKTQVTFK